MKKYFVAKVQGWFDILQLDENNFDEVVDKIITGDASAVIDKEFTTRTPPHIEFATSVTPHTIAIDAGDYVWTTEEGALFAMGKERFEKSFKQIRECGLNDGQKKKG